MKTIMNEINEITKKLKLYDENISFIDFYILDDEKDTIDNSLGSYSVKYFIKITNFDYIYSIDFYFNCFINYRIIDEKSISDAISKIDEIKQIISGR
jgi:hypothetical protein